MKVEILRDPLQPYVYIPEGAKINVENKDMLPPPVEYESRKKIFDKDAVKQVVKGTYANKDE